MLAAKRDLELPRMLRKLRKLDNFDLLVIDDLDHLQQADGESDLLFMQISERYEHPSLGITSNLVFSEWKKVFANPMAAAAIDRIVHHSVVLEFDVPSYRPNAAQNRRTEEESDRQECLTWITPLHRTPTQAQQVRWEAVQKAKKQGLSLRPIARKLGMSRVASKKCAVAESPPKRLGAKERGKAGALASSTIAAD